ncbi:MAG: hypothetical protein AAGU19_01270 [Prolixibacteraceae bacterium]
MSLNIAIIELSKQVASLQSELELLRREKEAYRKQEVLKRPKSKSLSGTKIKLLKCIRKMEQEHYDMLCQKYKDEIEFIRKRYPDWRPAKKLFDMQG